MNSKKENRANLACHRPPVNKLYKRSVIQYFRLKLQFIIENDPPKFRKAFCSDFYASMAFALDSIELALTDVLAQNLQVSIVG